MFAALLIYFWNPWSVLCPHIFTQSGTATPWGVCALLLLKWQTSANCSVSQFISDDTTSAVSIKQLCKLHSYVKKKIYWLIHSDKQNHHLKVAVLSHFCLYLFTFFSKWIITELLKFVWWSTHIFLLCSRLKYKSQTAINSSSHSPFLYISIYQTLWSVSNQTPEEPASSDFPSSPCLLLFTMTCPCGAVWDFPPNAAPQLKPTIVVQRLRWMKQNSRDPHWQTSKWNTTCNLAFPATLVQIWSWRRKWENSQEEIKSLYSAAGGACMSGTKESINVLTMNQPQLLQGEAPTDFWLGVFWNSFPLCATSLITKHKGNNGRHTEIMSRW